MSTTRDRWSPVPLAGLILVLVAGATGHDLHPAGPGPRPPRVIAHTPDRAGWPLLLGRRAQASRPPGGVGYYVGGGAALGHGEARRRVDGTWGWDETGGPYFRRRAELRWWHGRRPQGATGAYRTDPGP